MKDYIQSKKKTMSKYFNQDFHDFFKELAANNTKDWMDENRKRYTKNIKEPFENFIKDLQTEVSKFDEEILVKPNDSIFRINRDIRFSKDKAPYKLDRSAIISKHGRKDKQYPGFYISISPQDTYIGGGAYFLENEALQKVRQEISYNLKEFDQLVNNKKFKQNFGEIKGEKAKRLAPEFQEDEKVQALIANKGFYYMKDLDANIIFKDDFLETIVEKYKTAKPFNDFLRRAIYH